MDFGNVSSSSRPIPPPKPQPKAPPPIPLKPGVRPPIPPKPQVSSSTAKAVPRRITIGLQVSSSQLIKALGENSCHLIESSSVLPQTLQQKNLVKIADKEGRPMLVTSEALVSLGIKNSSELKTNGANIINETASFKDKNQDNCNLLRRVGISEETINQSIAQGKFDSLLTEGRKVGCCSGQGFPTPDE